MLAGGLKRAVVECVEGLSRACDDFYAELRPLFTRIAARIAEQYRRSGETDDLIQEMYLKLASVQRVLARSLPDEDGAARAYLAALAANAARDYFRAKGQALYLVPITDRAEELRELWSLPCDTERDVLFRQIEALLPKGREGTIFRLYYRQGYSIPEIAAIPSIGLSLKAAESVILRTCRKLKDRIAGKVEAGSSNTRRTD